MSMNGYGKKLTICMLGIFSLLLIFFKINFLKKIFQGYPPKSQTVWIQVRPDILSSLIWTQSVSKGYSEEDETQTGNLKS